MGFPNYLDYVNHSCNPNMRYDVTELAFFAVRDISKGEELTYDYDTTEYDLVKSKESFTCKCGALNCRLEIRGSKYRHLFYFGLGNALLHI